MKITIERAGGSYAIKHGRAILAIRPDEYTAEVFRSAILDEMCNTLSIALQQIASKDPAGISCGPNGPAACENGCIGCIARYALQSVADQRWLYAD